MKHLLSLYNFLILATLLLPITGTCQTGTETIDPLDLILQEDFETVSKNDDEVIEITNEEDSKKQEEKDSKTIHLGAETSAPEENHQPTEITFQNKEDINTEEQKPTPEGEFTRSEINQIINYWHQPGRYTTSAPSKSLELGPWQLRITPKGSHWFWKYNRLEKTKTEKRKWDNWLDKKVRYDRHQVLQRISSINVPWADRKSLEKYVYGDTLPITPLHPGPVPAKLLEKLGNPPCFATLVTPLQYKVVFDNGIAFQYIDNVRIRHPKWKFYRFSQGVESCGKKLKNIDKSELTKLYQKAGYSPSERKVFEAVSHLEGGFEAVTTYDTGYISVGFVQFTSGKTGLGNLSKLLFSYKKDSKKYFNKHFRRFGIDVNAKKQLVVIDPETGAKLIGEKAVIKVIEDKRLTAVFQRAGKYSNSFKIAQLKVAKSIYYPGLKKLYMNKGSEKIAVQIKDIIKSEAGMAVLLDRKIKRGNLGIFKQKLAQLVKNKGLSRFESAARYERELIQELIYRKNFLKDKKLSQPRA